MKNIKVNEAILLSVEEQSFKDVNDFILTVADDDETIKKIPDSFAIRNQFVRITLLNLKDEPVKDEQNKIIYLQGVATSGSISINGQSAIRRTCNLSLMVDKALSNITNADNQISINKRIKLEIGIQNGALLNQDIYWYNLGIYQITDANCQYNSSGLKISLSLKDKMCLLNGECGGIITNPMIHSPIDVIKEDGTIVREQVLIIELIKSIVREFIDLSDNQIKINDIPVEITNIVRWIGSENLKLIPDENKINGKTVYQVATGESSQDITGALSYGFNEDIGYQFIAYTWAPDNQKEFSSNPGEAATSLLDKIKEQLGNFEYFFDIDGNFVFQEIKNGINQGSSKISLAEAIADQYLVDFGEETNIEYTFDNSYLVTSYTTNPQFNVIKNDIICWGTKDKQENAIRYHLLIDNRPKPPEKTYFIDYYTDDFGVRRAKKNGLTAVSVDENTDWRQYLYLEYITTGKEVKYDIGRELEQEWPKIYDIENNEFYSLSGDKNTSTLSKIHSLSYFIDILDPNDIENNEVAKAALENISITKIGQRQKSKTEKNVNTIFNPQPEGLYYLELSSPTLVQDRYKAISSMMDSDSGINSVVQVNDSVAQNIAIGTTTYSAFDHVRMELNEVLGANEVINIAGIPIYWLEPNTRIRVINEETHIGGDFIINSISIPLATNGTMNISAKRIIERI